MQTRLLATCRLFTLRAWLVTCLAVAGCAASGPLAPEDMDRAAKSAVVPEGKAALYIIRPDYSYGSLVLFKIVLDGQSETVLGPGNYAFKLVSPGTHAILVECACANRISIETRSGQEHFVSVEPNSLTGGEDFTELAPTKGREALKKERLVRWLR